MTKQKKAKKTEEKQKQTQEEIRQDQTKILDKITSSNIFRFSMIGLITLILFFTIYSYIQHKIYQDSLSQNLPLDSTYAFFEVKNSNLLDQTQKLKTHPNQEEISQLLNLEESILNKTVLTPILKRSSQKNISIQVEGDQKHYLFLYDLAQPDVEAINFPVQIIDQSSDTKWHYSLKGNTLSISDDKEISLKPFQESPKLNTSTAFQDAFLNTPKHNIAWFGVNHSFSQNLSQDSIFSSNTESLLLPVTQFLGFTIGYININTQGLLIGSYSNPNPELDLTLSPLRNLDRFNPTLHKYLPPLQDIDALVSATESYTILEKLLQNNPTNQILIQNLATKRNLSAENLNTIQDLLSTEYLIYKQAESYTLILPKLSDNQKADLLDILTNLEAFHNPVTNAYRLEDGSTARTKSSSEPIPRELTEEKKSFIFRLSDISQTIQADFSNQTHTKITYSPNQNSLQSIDNNLQEEQQSPQKFINLLPEGSSHFYISKNQTLDLLQSQDLDLYPANINSSSYFFDDGIQILFQLSW